MLQIRPYDEVTHAGDLRYIQLTVAGQEPQRLGAQAAPDSSSSSSVASVQVVVVCNSSSSDSPEYAACAKLSQQLWHYGAGPASLSSAAASGGMKALTSNSARPAGLKASSARVAAAKPNGPASQANGNSNHQPEGFLDARSPVAVSPSLRGDDSAAAGVGASARGASSANRKVAKGRKKPNATLALMQHRRAKAAAEDSEDSNRPHSSQMPQQAGEPTAAGFAPSSTSSIHLQHSTQQSATISSQNGNQRWQASPEEEEEEGSVASSARAPQSQGSSAPRLIHSVWVNFQPDERSNAVLGDDFKHLHGPQWLWQSFGGPNPNAFSPGSFMQANVAAMRAAMTAISRFVPPASRVCELHAGVGVIGLQLASTAQLASLTCVEINPHCAAPLQQSRALLQGALDVRFITAAAGEAAAGDELQSADVLIVDPPRKGLEPDLLQVTVVVSVFRV